MYNASCRINVDMAVIERATQMLVVRHFFTQEAAQTPRNETRATNLKMVILLNFLI